MVSEYELPCTECGGDLTKAVVQTTEDSVTIAECPDCGTRHYPEPALSSLRSHNSSQDSGTDSEPV